MEMERAWHILGQMEAMTEGDWHLFRVRPGNHPRRRLLGAALLLDRFMVRGLVDGLREVVLQGSWRALRDALVVETGGRSLIGSGRAGDIGVNGVLPFFHCLATREGDGRLADASLRLYRSSPRLQENELTREMRQQLLPRGWERVVCNARRQQGLLHLYGLLSGAGQRDL
jgi:hypothetical protein